MAKHQGFVLWWNDGKGYGFITDETDNKDVFVHHTQIQGTGFATLKQNQRVEFDIADSTDLRWKGAQAIAVVKLDG